MASAATEDLMRMAHPLLMNSPKTGRKAILSCTPDEYHQIGGRMVADLMELAGWQVAFLGANTPIDSLVLLVEQFQPDLVGLSTTLPANLSKLQEAVEVLRDRFGDLTIVVGGQALGQMPGLELPPSVRYIESVDQIHSL
jgi:methanogenic corrinoid protein MtbC1